MYVCGFLCVVVRARTGCFLSASVHDNVSAWLCMGHMWVRRHRYHWRGDRQVDVTYMTDTRVAQNGKILWLACLLEIFMNKVKFRYLHIWVEASVFSFSPTSINALFMVAGVCGQTVTTCFPDYIVLGLGAAHWTWILWSFCLFALGTVPSVQSCCGPLKPSSSALDNNWVQQCADSHLEPSGPAAFQHRHV